MVNILHFEYVEHIHNALLRIGDIVDPNNGSVDLDDTTGTTKRANNRRRIESQLVSENRVSSENVTKCYYGISKLASEVFQRSRRSRS